MLRITRSEKKGAAPVIRLEGKLLQPWVEEVSRLFLAADVTSLPRLDLSCVTFVDEAGGDLLQQLLQRGVEIEACTPYVAELLHRLRNR